MSRVSASQSRYMSLTYRKLPLVSPLVHRQFLLLDQKVILPSLTVRLKASSFMYPSISTFSVHQSCTITGISPSPVLERSKSLNSI